MIASLEVNVAEQSLRCLDAQQQELIRYPISTAAKGTGQQNGSECTPLGQHIIRAKIGADAPENAVFVGRRFTGEIYSPALDANNPGRDWILSRILWLSGSELGKNRLGKVDTFRRYIYLHGTPDKTVLGQAGSRGCIRMRNADIIELFSEVKLGSVVEIREQ